MNVAGKLDRRIRVASEIQADCSSVGDVPHCPNARSNPIYRVCRDPVYGHRARASADIGHGNVLTGDDVSGTAATGDTIGVIGSCDEEAVGVIGSVPISGSVPMQPCLYFSVEAVSDYLDARGPVSCERLRVCCKIVSLLGGDTIRSTPGSNEHK